MKLSEIVENIEYISIDNFVDYDIVDVTSDSREQLENSLFIGIKGFNFDGAVFSDKAVRNGAVCVVYETKIETLSPDVCYIKVENTRQIQSKIASIVYGKPSDKLTCTAITGTNGKTSTAFIYHHIISMGQKKKCGLFGNIKYDLGEEIIDEPANNTPDAVLLQRYINKMQNNNCSNMVMEVSSHALELNRVDEIKYDVSIFTNLTQDHLDFHKTMDNYAEAKGKLFSKYSKKNGWSILNADDDKSDYFKSKCINNIAEFSLKNENSDLYVKKFFYSDRGLVLDLIYKDERKIDFTVKTNLIGNFQVYNLAGAILASLKSGVSIQDIQRSFESDIEIPGRMQKITGKNIFIDYAHTPDALFKAIKSFEGVYFNRMVTVFGCGGDRDKSKRPEMGNCSLNNSDVTIVTSDNPRTESPELIIEDIVADFKKSDNFIVIQDREEAIKYAVQNFEADDIILIAGKGHETYQEINGIKHHFSDIEIVNKYI